MAFYTPPRTPTTHNPSPPSNAKPFLPPIAHLDRHLAAAKPPPTPPADDVVPYIDWLDISRSRPAHFIAEKTCEMICYLWFATSAPEHSYPTPTSSPPFSHRPNPATTTLQLVAMPTFVQFMQKLLETTQVSQSVIVLSLHYIYRLKDRNRFTPAQPGSEFRIAVAGLMMANKFLDDNTYTNKTWSEVSGIDLAEINRMEKEFLTGVDFNLYVDKSTYESWLNLLKGLVQAKDRDSRHFRRKNRSAVRAAAKQHPSPSSRVYSNHRHHRARSTSPTQSRRPTYSHPTSPVHLQSGSKRSAQAAFSPPTAAAFPCKRQLQLQIPEFITPRDGAPHSHSPLEGLQSFATMSLASPRHWRHVPETLVTPYSVTEERRTSVPQNLYFYTLACSPMDRDEDTHSRARKARLRYHQPPPPPPDAYAARYPYYHPYSHPNPHSHHVVQSASTSPHECHMGLHVYHPPVLALASASAATHSTASYSLPHFHDTQWTPAAVAASTTTTATTTTYQQQQQKSPLVPSAPFANAGPPGVQFYPTPPVQGSCSVYGWGLGAGAGAGTRRS